MKLYSRESPYFLHRQPRVEVWSLRDVCHKEREALKMKKTQIIKQIVGERLKEYGFTYLKTDGPCRIFVREVQGIKRYYDPENQVVKQYINIQESKFSKSLIVRFHTDAFGHGIEQGLEELKKYGTGGWISYLDEESYKEKLRLLADLTVEYGLDLLEKMSHEEETIPTKTMAEKLFNEHKQLADTFAEEYHIKINPEQLGDIDEWFGKIKEVLMKSIASSYEDVKELLIKIAAFIGEKACEINAYKWLFPSHFKAPEIVGSDPFPNYMPLNIVVNGWKNKCDAQSWKVLEEFCNMLKQGMA